MRIKTVGITVKKHLEEKKFVQEVIKKLEQAGVRVAVCERTDALLSGGKGSFCGLEEGKIDLMLAFGGDGTILRMIHKMPKLDAPIVSVNFGTLGFLTEFDPEAFWKFFPKMVRGDFQLDQRMLLEIKVIREGKEAYRYAALNEAVIARDSLARVVHLPTEIDGQEVTTYVADGLIVATPTGSTAYSLSAGGPILHPQIGAMILTPIAAHSLTQKPIVVPSGSRIRFFVKGRSNAGKVNLTVDGQIGVGLMDGDVIEIKKNRRSFKFVREEEDCFFRTLQKKISWGESGVGIKIK